MYKLFFYFLIFFSISLYSNDKVEIYTSSLEVKQNIVYATGGVDVVYKNHLLRAKKAIYNKNNGDLELFNNIELSYNNQYRVLGNYAKLNLIQKEKIFKPFYILEKESDVWITANKGTIKKEVVSVKNGILSGCKQIKPLWKMEFSDSNYNANTKWINIYNATLYFYDIPILYTPYFGYSLGTQRESGFLMPSFGVSSTEGFYYQQPLYIAEYDNWDLEIDPQIRTERGKGIYTTFRFVDSDKSSGIFKTGYFQENIKYFKDQKLYNNTHYGFNFDYIHADPLNEYFHIDLPGQSGLFLKISGMNDVDYINLEKNNNIETNTASQIFSRINMFYNTDKNYYATYFKYYQNLTLKSNADTMQKLPTLHYHSYLEKLFSEHIHYNLDIKTTNIQNTIRTKYKTAQQTDMNIPLTFHTSLFDEYLNVSYQANLYAQHTKFLALDRDTIINGQYYSNGLYGANNHTFKISTELARGFSKVNHVLSFSASYRLNGARYSKGYYKNNKDYCLDPNNKTKDICSFYNIKELDDALDLEFTQYIYDKSSREILYHRLAQNISYKDNQNRYGELENELDYALTRNFSFYNNMFFNYDEKTFSKIFNKITFKNTKVKVNLSHLYKDLFTQQDSFTSYLTSSLKYYYNRHYSYKFRYDYDLQKDIKKSAEIGFLYEKRCWNFGLSYVENNRPHLTQNFKLPKYDRYIYITIVLKPIMSVDEKTSAFGFKLPE